MKKHAIIFASLALSCLVLSAPLSAGAVSSSQTEASSLYIITVQPELPVTERSELELTALEMTQTWQNPNPRRQLALKSVSRAGCSVYRWSSSAPVVASVDASGLVTALAPGSSHQCIHHAGETLTCTVTVTSEIGKVTLDADVLLLHSIGSQQDLIPTVAVQEPSAVALQWTSSDPSVAVVDADGTVTAVADGKAIVTVRTPEGRSAGCAVYVGQAAADYESGTASSPRPRWAAWVFWVRCSCCWASHFNIRCKRPDCKPTVRSPYIIPSSFSAAVPQWASAGEAGSSFCAVVHARIKAEGTMMVLRCIMPCMASCTQNSGVMPRRANTTPCPVVELGIHRPRAERTHVDRAVQFLQLPGNTPGQADHIGLAGIVARHIGPRRAAAPPRTPRSGWCRRLPRASCAPQSGTAAPWLPRSPGSFPLPGRRRSPDSCRTRQSPRC